MFWKYQTAKETVKAERIYSLFERTYRSDYNFSGEAHNFWEFLYVESGAICVTADERVHNLSAGEMIVHKPLELHKFFITGGEEAKLFIFSCSADGEICRKIENKVCRLGRRQKSVMRAFLEYLHEEAQSRSVLPDASECSDWLPVVGEDAVFSHMTLTYITQILLTLSQSNTDSVTSTDADAEIFGKAVDYMKRHISGIPCVREIAEYLNISESGLQRAFDKYAKMGVHKYLISLKIKTAMELLEQGISVCDTAERLGYSSQNYFSAAFKRETGKSPSKAKSENFK